MLSALEMGIHPPESFGRIHHLPKERLTDELALPPYEALSTAELGELVAELEPITGTLVAAGSQ